MGQSGAPHPNVVRVKGLGPGFWPFTAVLTVLSIAQAFYFLYGNVDWVFPGASHPVADRGSDIDGLFKFMSVFGTAIFIYVTGYVVYFAVVFRARKDDPPDTIGVPIHDAPALEFWWTIIPTLLLAVLIWVSIAVWNKVYFGTGAPALTSEVVGHQFYFEWRYPGLKGSIYSKNEPMHLPVGVPVRILMTSTDVIHQFWVPEIRLKGALVPGLIQNINFTPQQTGEYDIVCTEFCGKDHALMRARLIIEPIPAFDAWLAKEKTLTAQSASQIDVAHGNADAGKTVFAQKCSACHSNPPTPFDQKLVGPGLLHITDDPAHPKLVDGDAPSPENIAKLLQKGFTGPLGAMPNASANGISPQDIANLTAYLASLK